MCRYRSEGSGLVWLQLTSLRQNNLTPYSNFRRWNVYEHVQRKAVNNLRLNVCLKKQVLFSGDSQKFSDDTFVDDEYLPEESFKKINRSHNNSFNPQSNLPKLLFSFWQNSNHFWSTEVNEANDNLVIENSDEILEDSNEYPGQGANDNKSAS